MKEFIGTCVENPFSSLRILQKVIEDAKAISKQTFLKHCEVEPHILHAFNEYPNDYEFYRYNEVCFYTWSAIEHFYN